MRLFTILLSFFVFYNLQVHALPIDWSGHLGFDTNIINNVTRVSNSCTPSNDNYCPGDEEQHARYQSYVFRLSPSIIINDGVTVKGELSTNNIRGGFMGEDINANKSYHAQSPNGNQGISVNQLYAELYSDTALFTIGKFSRHFGLGAVIHSGDDTWDRFLTTYNGFEANFSLGKFSVAPFWAKVRSPGLEPDGTRKEEPNGSYDATETGLRAFYDDPNRNLKVGVNYSVRNTEKLSTLYPTGGTHKTKVTLIDIFFSKSWEKLSLGLEIPMLTGSVGTMYGNSSSVDIDANAYILEASYQLNPRWKFGVNAGTISGENGQGGFDALYLHPNYKVGELMLAYNYFGFQDGAENVFYRPITNTTYFMGYFNYQRDTWTWRMNLLFANANETAKSGQTFYNHETSSFHTANADQSNELGLEVDFAFDYQWNPNLLITGYLAYWQVGKFYEFNNTAQDESVENMTATGMRVSLSF